LGGNLFLLTDGLLFSKRMAHVAIDPKDLGELQKALNEAAGKASILWTTFITFQLYLAIAFGSVTHRDLFLETSIKLPLLNVDLSLIGFFVVAPLLLLIFHFYLFLQLLGLASKAKDYNTLLVDAAPAASDRRYLRQRLDVFPILQFLAGPSDQRTGFRGYSLRLMAWITLVATPVLILLQAQVTFLPYHREWIVWLQRVAVLIDLALIWYFWIHLRSDDDPINGVLRKAWMFLGGAGTLCVIVFSTYLATFPGEWIKTHLPEPSSLQALLFEGDVDEVSGRPRSIFSNRLVLTDQSFVVDPEKLDKITISHSFRGRDLRLAVLYLTDLRKADFTGAQLQGASLDRAQLQGASLDRAQLQGAWLMGAQLQGASLHWAQLQGAELFMARLEGAALNGAQLQGAILHGAQLHGASLDGAQLQGAWLNGAQLQGAILHGAQLHGATLNGAQLQGAALNGAQLQGALLVNVLVWRAFGTPNLDLADLRNIDAHQKPWRGDESFAKWRDAIASSVPASFPASLRRNLMIERLAMLDPTGKKEPEDVLDQRHWDNAHSSQPQGEEVRRTRAVFLADLACLGDSAPYVARGLLRNLHLKGHPELLDAGGLKLFTDRLSKGKSDPATCPGVRGFTDTDWADLSKLSPETLMSR
jgi:uncharacterized protein YjbI with pentapeptide repeats